jgi:hypothetical protein
MDEPELSGVVFLYRQHGCPACDEAEALLSRVATSRLVGVFYVTADPDPSTARVWNPDGSFEQVPRASFAMGFPMVLHEGTAWVGLEAVESFVDHFQTSELEN